jgi:hypothetical protein
MTSVKSFGILIGTKGEGAQSAHIAEIARHRRERGKAKALPLIDNDQEGLGSAKPTPI